MGTDTRIFEPLIGAAGAVLVATPSLGRRMHRWAASLLSVGVTGLIAGIVMIAAFPSSYYRGGAVLISIATVAVIGPLWVGRGGALERALGWGPRGPMALINYEGAGEDLLIETLLRRLETEMEEVLPS